MRTIETVTLEYAVKKAIEEYRSVREYDCGSRLSGPGRQAVVERLAAQAHQFADTLEALPANDAARLIQNTFTANYEPRGQMWIHCARMTAHGAVYVLSHGALCNTGEQGKPVYSTNESVFLKPFLEVLCDEEKEELTIVQTGLSVRYSGGRHLGNNWAYSPADLREKLDKACAVIV